MTSKDAEKYKTMSEEEHILARPGMFIGPPNIAETDFFITLVDENNKISQGHPPHSTGFVKLLDELLVNSVDNAIEIQPPKMTRLDVTCQIFSAKGSKTPQLMISVANDGNTIPIEVNKETGLLVPHMIFGKFRTSSNYDEDPERLKGGTHGYGAKLTNIFSSHFEVYIENSHCNKSYNQVWVNNMKEVSDPKITPQKISNNLTKIIYVPDLKRFFDPKYIDIHIEIMRGRVFEIAAVLARLGVSVYWNNKKVKVSSFRNFIEELNPDTTQETLFDLGKGKDIREYWEVLAKITNKPKSISIVNSVNTYNHGKHMKYVLDAIVEKLIKKMPKSPEIDPKDILAVVKKYVEISMLVTVKAPEFKDENKIELTKTETKFEDLIRFTDAKLNKLVSELQDILVSALSKQELEKLDKELQKTKRSGLKIPKLRDALRAGSEESSKCVLIVTEGDSAAALAIAGLEVVGNDYYGVFPLRGKLINVLKNTQSTIAANQEIKDLLQILGINVSDPKKSHLRYGNLMIMADEDLDGYHIRGLVAAFAYKFLPHMMTADPPFLSYFVTPIIKARRGKETEAFYNLETFKAWEEKEPRTEWKIKYYKGLGTSTSLEAKEYFKNLEEHARFFTFENQEAADKAMMLAFGKSMEDERKKWVEESIPKEITTSLVPYEEFVNSELVEFSQYDCKRSIPSLFDGLKPSERKILYTCIVKKHDEIKVAELSGEVANLTEYLHGEASLNGAIVAMAETFVGSNNLNLLTPIGQFGTRLDHNSAASPRYIYTRLNPLMKLIFRDEDLPILDYDHVEGKKVEPINFAPIIPMILVNGSSGIGTGYSTSIPCFSANSLIKILETMLNGKSHRTQKLEIEYKGFTGRIEIQQETRKISTYGAFHVERDGNEIIIHITELPVSISISKFETKLKDLMEKEGLFNDFLVEPDNEKVNISIYGPEFDIRDPENIISTLGLYDHHHTSNMVLYQKDGTLHKFANAEQILLHYYEYRLEMYAKRREYQINDLEEKLEKETQRLVFIKDFMANKIKLFHIPKDKIVEEMIELKYVKSKGSYEYLLSMAISSLSKERMLELEKLIEELTDSLNYIRASTPETLWLHDLQQLKEFEPVPVDGGHILDNII